MINVFLALVEKTKKSKTLVVLLVLSVLLPFANVLLYYALAFLLAETEAVPLDMAIDALGFDGRLQIAEISATGTAGLLSMIAIAILLGGELSSGTIKNAITANKSRTQIFGAYSLFGLCSSVVITLLYYFVSLIATSIFFGYGAYSWPSEISVILTVVVLDVFVSWQVSSLCVLCVFLLKKSAKAWAFFMPLFILTGVSVVVELLASAYVQIDPVSGALSFESWVGWLPTMQPALLANSFTSELALKCVASSAFFATITTALSYLSIRKADF